MNQTIIPRIRQAGILLLSLVLLSSSAALFRLRDAGCRRDAAGHAPDLSREYLVTQYPDATGVQGTFYTITNDSSLIIIDGGWAENESAVRNIIAKHGNVVDA